MDIEDLLEMQPSLPKNSLNYMLAENIRKTLAKAEARVRKTAETEGRAEGRAEGHAAGLAEGEERGLMRGKEQLLAAQLNNRFGPLPANAIGCLARASETQLDALAIAMLAAPTLAEALAKAGLDA
jgi:flagellar biosynthesis/type III secretory pathway protein FliH